jgi:hypothetical protein
MEPKDIHKEMLPRRDGNWNMILGFCRPWPIRNTDCALLPLLSHFNPAHTLSPCFYGDVFNITIAATTYFSKLYFQIWRIKGLEHFIFSMLATSSVYHHANCFVHPNKVPCRRFLFECLIHLSTLRLWSLVIWYDIWCDMIYLTAIGLPPGGSTTVHNYTQTVHRTIQFTNLGRVRTVPRPCEVYPGICLTTEEKARKNLSQGSRRTPVDKEYTEQSILVNKNKESVFILRTALFWALT